jgi:hypothetical protein
MGKAVMVSNVCKHSDRQVKPRPGCLLNDADHAQLGLLTRTTPTPGLSWLVMSIDLLLPGHVGANGTDLCMQLNLDVYQCN